MCMGVCFQLLRSFNICVGVRILLRFHLDFQFYVFSLDRDPYRRLLASFGFFSQLPAFHANIEICLLYTSDAADE